jgi:hypothetical protein
LLCEHLFVTAQGSALTRYRRALERRHIFGAEIAAKEMAYVSLRDALGLLALYAAEGSPKYGKAATRWLGRLALESDDLSLDDAQLAAAALQALPRRPDSAMKVLSDLSRHLRPFGFREKHLETRRGGGGPERQGSSAHKAVRTPDGSSTAPTTRRSSGC